MQFSLIFITRRIIQLNVELALYLSFLIFKTYLNTTKMVVYRSTKWLYAVAGSGMMLGIYNYFQQEKSCAQTSWTTNFVPSVKWDENWDKRSLSSLVKPSSKSRNNVDEENRYNEIKNKPTATRNLILIRHGQYHINAKFERDKLLTELGQKQAHLTGQRLKDLNYNFTKLIRSTMARALQTSDIIHKYLPNVPIESCELLKEGAPIPPEPPIGSWRPEAQFFEDGARIEAAFRKYFHRADASQEADSYEILVCHANVIRYFICRVLQFPPEAWLRFSLHHCSMSWVSIKPNGRVVVYTIGDCGHLPSDKLTTS